MCFKFLEPANVWELHSDHLKRHYVCTRFITEQEEWPPDQPKHFTSLALIHYKDGYTEREVIATHSAVDDIMSSTRSRNASSEQSEEQDKRSIDINEIFAPSEDGQEPCTILIEGAPGIGKTVLSKEIAFRWANGLLLVDKILLYLIFLRDPLVQKVTSLKDLVKYYYRFDESSDRIASSCADYLLHSGGEHVTFVFDGYDEYPESLQQSGFMSDILQRKILPCCHLVVTSRSHASARLRVNFDRFIEILGFAREHRHDYIISSLKNKDVVELNEYLDDHPTISSLCFIPFYMTVLLWLYKQEITLPDSSAELYSYFICHTIRHHLAKSKIFLSDNFVNLDSLEEPYRQLVHQLSFLSYKALGEDQLIFTLDQIKADCPQIDEIPGASNGFGLLQAIRHFGFINSTTLYFVHVSVQEFLAAYHITCLSHYEEFCIFKEKFMSDFMLTRL